MLLNEANKSKLDLFKHLSDILVKAPIEIVIRPDQNFLLNWTYKRNV